MPKLTKTENGLTIAIGEEEKPYLCKTLLDKGSVYAWCDLLEHYTCNGWNILSPDNFALCSNPFLLTDDVTYDEKDEPVYGTVYFYRAHGVHCPIEELLEHGKIFLSATED